MNVEKKLYVDRISAGGSKSLQPVTEGTVLSVGDKIVARLTIRLEMCIRDSSILRIGTVWKII